MKQTPILLSTPMVQAILEGRKTQTRRVIKLSDGSNPDDSCISYSLNGKPENYVMDFTNHFPNWEPLHCPYGQPGDVLWVREEHYRYGHWEPDHSKVRKSGRQAWKFVPDTNEIRYYDNPPASFRKGRHHKDSSTPAWHKRLARFMPKAASRIFLKVKAIRVERLQDISGQDAKSEGIERMPTVHWWKNYLNNPLPGTSSPIESFISLWKSINGPNSWDENPYVWVIEFEKNSKTKYMSTFKSYKEESKKDWGSSDESLSLRQINTGCLLRIADATEAMSRNYQKLIDDYNYIKCSRDDIRMQLQNAENKIRTLKGVITKLKKANKHE